MILLIQVTFIYEVPICSMKSDTRVLWFQMTFEVINNNDTHVIYLIWLMTNLADQIWHDSNVINLTLHITDL